MAAAQAIEEYLERLQLVVAPYESRRTGTSIGRIRVVVRTHDQKIINLIRLYRNSINPEKLCKTTSTKAKRSPAARVMDEAIDLAVEDYSPYSQRAVFIDAGASSAGREIKWAADQGLSVAGISSRLSFPPLKPDTTLRLAERDPPESNAGSSRSPAGSASRQTQTVS